MQTATEEQGRVRTVPPRPRRARLPARSSGKPRAPRSRRNCAHTALFFRRRLHEAQQLCFVQGRDAHVCIEPSEASWLEQTSASIIRKLLTASTEDVAQ